MTDEPKPAACLAESPRFFQSVDWTAFWFAFALSLEIYLLTLAPANTLAYSGVFATDAMYPGPSVPPGHPLWAIYGWLFIKLIPVSNIAWRLNFASAVAGAVTCGLLAMLVSRVGILAVDTIPGFSEYSSRDQNAIRIVCGSVAGLGFGLDGCFWHKAVITDTWPLAMCLLALTLCLVTRWFFMPHCTKKIFMAAFVFGLALSDSQALTPAALGLPFLVAFANVKLGRDLLFGVSLFLWLFLLWARWSHLDWPVNDHDAWVLVYVSFATTVVWTVLTTRPRSLLSEWKPAGICVLLFFTGLSANFLLPIFSMANPPVNWGYPRTVEGFFHLLSRGRFEAFFPICSITRLMSESGIYAQIAVKDFGLLYLIAAAIPFVCLRRLPPQPRRWMLGLLLVWFIMTLLMLVMLNFDHITALYMKAYFAATHLVLALLSGCGLMLVAALCAKLTTHSRTRHSPAELQI